MPRTSVMRVAAVNPGAERIERSEYRMSALRFAVLIAISTVDVPSMQSVDSILLPLAPAASSKVDQRFTDPAAPGVIDGPSPEPC